MITRVLFFLFVPVQLYAQPFNAAPFHGMGNTGLASESLYSITCNAAGLANLSSTHIATAYQPHFMTKDLRTQAAYLGVPLKHIGAIGLGIRNYGIAQVSSFLTGNLVYARSFGGVFSTSVSANYHRFHVQDYVNDNAFSLDLGALIKLGEKVNVGLLFRNTTLTKFKDDTEQYLPAEAAAGFLYKISNILSLATDVYYEFDQGINIRSGIAYSIADIVILRAGASSNPMQYFGGIGLKWNRFQFDVSSAFHTRLGSSPQIALAYAF